MDVQTQLRSLKDFLMLYNQMTDSCFAKCVDEVNSRKLNRDEEDCVNSCSTKFVKANQRMMKIYVDVQSSIINKRLEEAETSAAEAAAAEAATVIERTEETVIAATAAQEDSTTNLQ